MSVTQQMGNYREKLDLRGVACPINFVRTKLKLEELDMGAELEVLLDDGEPIESVEKSLIEEGQKILVKSQQSEGYWLIQVKKQA